MKMALTFSASNCPSTPCASMRLSEGRAMAMMAGVTQLLWRPSTALGLSLCREGSCSGGAEKWARRAEGRGNTLEVRGRPLPSASDSDEDQGLGGGWGGRRGWLLTQRLARWGMLTGGGGGGPEGLRH